MHALHLARPPAPAPVVAALPRIGALAAAAGFVALAWFLAERASEHAVFTAAAAFSSTERITLPSVMIVARRDDLRDPAHGGRE